MLGRAAVAILTLALACLPGKDAHAQRAEAQDAFERGRKLMKDGDFKTACASFETSLKLEATVGTLYNLGLCHEKLGKLASAWAELKQVAETDSNKGRAADAAKRVAALEPRLTRMKIVISDPVPGLAVEREGIDVTAFVDQTVPVDPRVYKFKVTAPGQQPLLFEHALDREGETIDVQIPAFSTPKEEPPPTPAPSGRYPPVTALRPLAMPNGLYEVTASNIASTSDSAFEQTPIDGLISGRIGIQKFELGLRTTFHERYAEVMAERPNRLLTIAGTLAYSITPMFAGKLEYVRIHPFGRLGDSLEGSDLRVILGRKERLSPKIAFDGNAGFVFLQRANGGGGTANELVGETVAGLQFIATPRLSLEASALLQLNLGGELLSHTVTLGIAPSALYAVTEDIDVFARIFVGLLPAREGSSSSDFRTYTIGLNWRP
ncbi:MAG: hypothetical protein H0V17_26110 [Deltaproteobacteria bacterium]|nr:hypothetical protein [Deltaproteobacteria bacterium]